MLQFGNSVQTNLWTLAGTLHPLKVWKGTLNITDGKYTLSFRLKPHLWCMCTITLYIYYWKGLYNDTLITIASLVNGVLFVRTCINASILLDVTSESLYILLRARPAVWMPGKLLKPWQDPSVLILVQKLTESTWRQTHWMIWFIIAVVMGIIALTATAATAGFFIKKCKLLRLLDWHQYATELWARQNEIASEIVDETDDLRQAVLLSGERDFERTN